jgi:protein gp37
MNKRFGGPEYPHVGEPDKDAVRLDERVLTQPSRWKRPRTVFVCSMTDLFEESVPFEWIWRIFQVMRDNPHHTYQVLTKRPGRMYDFLQWLRFEWYAGRSVFRNQWVKDEFKSAEPLTDGLFGKLWSKPAGDYGADYGHIWVGTSIELDRYSWRAEKLRQIPAAVRFISAEPLLGPLDELDLTNIDWLIGGGESAGPPERRLVAPCEACIQAGRRPECGYCHGTGWEPLPDMALVVEDLRDHCLANGVAFLWKQWGGPTPKSGGRLIEGRTWDQMPERRTT